MQAKANIQNEHKVVITAENNKRRFEDANYNPIEMLFTYQGILQDLAEVIDAIQYGGIGRIEREDEEDAEAILEELRKNFQTSQLSRHITNYEDMLTFTQMLEDFRFICDNIRRA